MFQNSLFNFEALLKNLVGERGFEPPTPLVPNQIPKPVEVIETGGFTVTELPILDLLFQASRARPSHN